MRFLHCIIRIMQQGLLQNRNELKLAIMLKLAHFFLCNNWYDIIYLRNPMGNSSRKF